MLFTTRDDDFESEKERNLYYKLFAGYLFNELISGYGARLTGFADLITSCPRRGQAASAKPLKLSGTSTHTSFDNHAYLFADLALDRGEFADILLHDRVNQVVVALEAKVHSDWSYDKDVLANERRLQAIEAQMPGVHFFPCLLITAARWEECQRHDSQNHSNFRRFVEEPTCRTRVLLWEELIGLIAEPSVREHVAGQLDRPRSGSRYRFSNGWFMREPLSRL